MKIRQWFEEWGITGLKLNAGFVELEWQPTPDEQQAAWELYIELITRITTQPLPETDGDEATALASVYKLFEITRELLKAKGRQAETFSRIAVVILNQKIRPFTARWHRLSIQGAFENPDECRRFRRELEAIQQTLRHYAALLAAVAGVEDFQHLEQGPLESL